MRPIRASDHLYSLISYGEWKKKYFYGKMCLLYKQQFLEFTSYIGDSVVLDFQHKSSFFMSWGEMNQNILNSSFRPAKP